MNGRPEKRPAAEPGRAPDMDPDRDPMLAADNRAGRLDELERVLQSLRVSMHSLVAETNLLLEDIGVRAPDRTGKGASHLTVRARVMSAGGPAAMRFGLYEPVLRQFTHRSRVVDIDRPEAEWILGLDPAHRDGLLHLDRRRGILNHRARVAFHERRSLLLLDGEERGRKAALASLNRKPSITE